MGRLWHQTDLLGRLTVSAPEGKTDVPRGARTLPFLTQAV